MADMDHLKPVNDAFGHGAGDRAIAAVAEVLRSQLRATDMGARYGGDEFVLLLPHTGAGDGRILAERLCAAAGHRPSSPVGDRKVSLRTSFGVAELGPEAGRTTAPTWSATPTRPSTPPSVRARPGRGPGRGRANEAAARVAPRSRPLPRLGRRGHRPRRAGVGGSTSGRSGTRSSTSSMPSRCAYSKMRSSR